jgi:hypothetical protein
VFVLRNIMSVSPRLEKFPKPMSCHSWPTAPKKAALVMRFEEPSPRHRPTAFGVEHEAALQVLASKLAQRPDFLAGEWVRAIDAVLGPPDMDAAAIKLDHIPGQFAEFTGP